MEWAPRCPSPPGGSQGTGGPDRAGTAAAEEQPLRWAEGKEKEEEEGGAQAVQAAGDRVEVTAGGGWGDGAEGWQVGVPSLADPSVWRESGSGEAAERRRRRDENRQQKVGAAEQQWRTLWTEPCGGGGGGRRHLEEGYCGAETGSGAAGGRRGPDLSGHTDGSGSRAERRLQPAAKTDAVRAKDERAGGKSWSQAASAALCFDLEQRKNGGLPW